MLRRSLILVLMAVPAMLLAGCETKLPEERYPAMRFQDLPPVAVNIARIEVVEQYRPPLSPPNIEHEIPLSPISVMRNWAQDRLKAVGTAGTGRFIITEASVVREALKKTGGIKGAVTRDQEERFTARFKARLVVETAAGLGSGFAEAFVQRSQTVPENMTLKERDDKLYAFIREAGNEFNAEMELNIRRHLGPFVQ